MGQLRAGSSSGAGRRLDRFTKERLLDDWIYQAIVRPQWNQELRAAGVDVWNLPDVDAANARLQQLMELAPETKQVWPGQMCAQLRWPRTFEAHVSIQEEANEI